jgi:hypothetical protein
MQKVTRLKRIEGYNSERLVIATSEVCNVLTLSTL